MKKLKKFYINNRIYCILMCISIFSIALICILTVVYFVNQTKSSPYGNRLNGKDSVIINETKKEELSKIIKDNGKISKCSINVNGKIIYINVYLSEGTIEEAQGIAIKVVQGLSDDEREFYDLNFGFVKEGDNSFTIMGYKKSGNTIISWTGVNE